MTKTNEPKHTPEIWLNEDEEKGIAGCGCILFRNYEGSGNPAIVFCPEHDAAPDLLEACKKALPYLTTHRTMLELDKLAGAGAAVRNAIAKAEPKP